MRGLRAGIFCLLSAGVACGERLWVPPQSVTTVRYWSHGSEQEELPPLHAGEFWLEETDSGLVEQTIVLRFQFPQDLRSGSGLGVATLAAGRSDSQAFGYDTLLTVAQRGFIEEFDYSRLSWGTWTIWQQCPQHDTCMFRSPETLDRRNWELMIEDCPTCTEFWIALRALPHTTMTYVDAGLWWTEALSADPKQPTSLQHVRVFPNPATALLQWSANLTAVKVYDILGRQCMVCVDNVDVADISRLPAGKYFLMAEQLQEPLSFVKLP